MRGWFSPVIGLKIRLVALLEGRMVAPDRPPIEGVAIGGKGEACGAFSLGMADDAAGGEEGVDLGVEVDEGLGRGGEG